ncbi:hypothetical protein ABK040_009704 [Willaertia magna]
MLSDEYSADNEVILICEDRTKYIEQITGIKERFLNKLFKLIPKSKCSFIRNKKQELFFITILFENFNEIPEFKESNFIIDRDAKTLEEVKDVLKEFKNKSIIQVKIEGNFKEWDASHWISKLMLLSSDDKETIEKEKLKTFELNYKKWILQESGNGFKCIDVDSGECIPIENINKEPSTKNDQNIKYDINEIEKYENIDDWDFTFNLSSYLDAYHKRKGQYKVLRNESTIINYFIYHIETLFIHYSSPFFEQFTKLATQREQLLRRIIYRIRLLNLNDYKLWIDTGDGALDTSIYSINSFFNSEIIMEIIKEEWKSFISAIVEPIKSSKQKKIENNFEIELKNLLQRENVEIKELLEKKDNFYDAAISGIAKLGFNVTYSDLEKYFKCLISNDTFIQQIISLVYPTKFGLKIKRKQKTNGYLEALLISRIFNINIKILLPDPELSFTINSIAKTDKTLYIAIINDRYMSFIDSYHIIIKEKKLNHENTTNNYEISKNRGKPVSMNLNENTKFGSISESFNLYPKLTTGKIFYNQTTSSEVKDLAVNANDIGEETEFMNLVDARYLDSFFIKTNTDDILSFNLITNKEYIYDSIIKVNEYNSLKDILNTLQKGKKLGIFKIILNNYHFNNFIDLNNFLNGVESIETFIIKGKWPVGFVLPSNIKIKNLQLQFDQNIENYLEKTLPKQNFDKIDFIEVSSKEMAKCFEKLKCNNKIKYNRVDINENLKTKSSTNEITRFDEIERKKANEEEKKQNKENKGFKTNNINFSSLKNDRNNTKMKEIKRGLIESGWDGEGINVAVIDSGCDSQNSFLKDCRIIKRKSFCDPESDESTVTAIDETGHGTFCCGIIAGGGFIGIAPKVNLIVVKIHNKKNSGNTNSQDLEDNTNALIRALKWLLSIQEVHVISMSFTAEGYSSETHDLIQQLILKKVIVVCSAGNEGHKKKAIGYPARYGNTLCIGSCDGFGNKSKFSSVGRELDMLVIGEDVESCTSSSAEMDPCQFPSYDKTKRTACGSGTSFASPLIAGVCALIKSCNRSIDQQEMKNILKGLCPDENSHTKEKGHGVFDLGKLKQWLNENESSDDEDD